MVGGECLLSPKPVLQFASVLPFSLSFHLWDCSTLLLYISIARAGFFL